MESFTFDDVLSFAQTSYLLKTLNSEAQKRIISTVFRDGAVVYSRYETYNGHLSNDQILSEVKKYHEASKNDFQALFNVTSQHGSSNALGTQIALVRAFMKKKMYREAVLRIGTILKAEPGKSIFYFFLGQIRLELSEYDEAVKCFRKAIELDPNYADYHFHLGKSLLAVNQCLAAINEFIYAIKLNAYYGDAYFHLGLAYLQNVIVKEDYQLSVDATARAQHAFHMASQINPNLKDDAFRCGEEALRAGDVQQAFDSFRNINTDDDRERSQGFILDFHLRYLSEGDRLPIGEIQAHIEKLEKLTKRYASYADLHYELGIAYVLLGRCINRCAVKSLQNAVAINPDYSTAQRMLRSLTDNKRNIVS
ncbi:MAG: tetratricopeptide repeat protein [bacterium]